MRAFALAALCAAACSSSSPAGSPGAGSASSVSGTGAAAPIGGPQVKVLRPDIRSLPEPKIALPATEAFRLLDAGAAPRAPLRYRWDAKANRELTVTAALRTRRLLADGKWTDALPVAPVREGFGMITEPRPKGGAAIAFRGLVAEIVADSDAAATDRADEYVSAFRERLERRRGTIAVDDRGRLETVTFADARPAEDERDVEEVEQRWLAAAVPLPEEAIGAGARWRVVTVLRAGAAVVKQTADYTLDEVRPDRWSVTVLIRRVGEDQLVSAAGLPTGTIAELIAMFREIRGRVALSPSLPWPVEGSVTSELRIQARLGIPGEGVHDDLTEDTGTLTFSAD